jgi:N-acetylglucosamine-6-phosphate deacetylase
MQRGDALMRFGQVEVVDHWGQISIPTGAGVLDARGMILAPGFIDLQFNGGFGFDLTRNPESLWQVATELPRHGVTSFLPTIVTSPLSRVRLVQEIWRKGPPARYKGAQALGLHIEGPFLNPAKRGAHNPTYLRPPALEDVANWSQESGVWMVTLAPELLGALDVIATLTERGVVVGAGHSMATFDQARNAVTAGVRYATHLFNGMPQLHHRSPGLLGALLADERVTIGLIPDGLHVHPALIKLIWHMTGDDRLNLVTDAMAALDEGDGVYQMGGFEVTVKGKMAMLSNGTLAGSLLSMDEALRNLFNFTGCSQAEAVRTITTTPATLLGVSDRKGQIAPGFDADVVVLTPDFRVVATVIAGQLVYLDETASLKLRRMGTGELHLP